MYASRTRKEKFSDHDENCEKNVSGLEDSLVTSSRPPCRPQKRPDDRTSNAGVAVRTADGSQGTAGDADERCLGCGCSSFCACWCSMFTMTRRPSTWPTCVVAATITISAHQHVVTLMSDGQGHALLTAHVLLQIRLRGTHFRLASWTLIRMILSAANWTFTCFLHLYRLHCINCIVVRRCWAPVEWRHSKLS